ncbi:ribosome biogenesis GTPase YlqF [Halopseudomonas pelagia]|uniref:Ribosome biogenesis GTPase A n=1 Tax=Halopseudomonas pelagia TaxID=553151 RepID=A0AA91U038_9GAMM|nr:ribosome biogenesis GTPase YlqF [Halopseudomonas pelagia]PCC98002.1 ribosome biogenesis GTPase YlqF [Halopseudomonas pelagia]QFY55724.1 ribosome biogenesis GTPase YlqF [Halopseudomonas pelagia]
MAIQWYPGHMHKAQKAIREVLPQVDLLIEVLDARIPYSSENPAIAEIRGDKPCIKVLSKTDLADPVVTAAWQEHLEQERGVKTFATTTEQPGRIKLLVDLCRKMLPEKEAGAKNINAMIVGIPNVGKSTIINTLAGRVVAKTGNEPAVTKDQQRINLGSGVVLLDTPGILWPKIENPNSSYRLAATGAIKNTAMEYDDVSFFVAEYLIKAYPELIQAHFQLEYLPSTELEFLEMAGARRGALRAGGKVNLHKICEVLINELRSGKLGLISLETPALVEQEKIAIAEAKLKKESENAERKKRFKEGSRNSDRADRKEQKNQPPAPSKGTGSRNHPRKKK